MFGVQTIFQRLQERLNDHHCERCKNNNNEKQ